MEDVRDVIELVGERVDKTGLCTAGPSAWCHRLSVQMDDRMSVPCCSLASQVITCTVFSQHNA